MMHRRPCCQSCSNPETWIKTGFKYKKEYDQAQGRMRTRVEGPNSQETIYEVPFNEKNLKTLFDKRITPDYITPQQKAEARQNAIEMGLLPREAGGQEVQQATAPPKGTYG